MELNIQRTITNALGITNKEKGSTRLSHGMIDRNEVKEINKLITNKKEKKSLTVQILHKVAKEIYTKIWLLRNQEAAEKKKTRRKRKTEVMLKTVAGEIEKEHCKITTERNTILKTERWAKMFIKYNTSPIYINSLRD